MDGVSLTTSSALISARHDVVVDVSTWDHNASGLHAVPSLLEVVGLTKRYGEQIALADVGFAANAGEVLGLIGPNGAGKTTLLEAIAGVLPADGGRVLWRGMSLPLPQRRECMFYLPDGLRPWEDQYVARVIAFFTAVYGRPESVVAETVRTLVLAIHQLIDAERVCDRFVLLADGRVRGVGTLGDLRAHAGKASAGLED